MIQSVTPLKSIEVQDYLDATSDASNRTRSVIITMVVASVLIFGALINSFQHQWMLERLKALDSPQSPYTQKKIGPYPALGEFHTPQAYQEAVTNYDKRYRSFYDAVARSYVENALSTKVPLFGFSIDANDLGILGDLYTNNIGKLINGFHNLFLFASEFISFGFLVALTLMAVTRLKRIDGEWDAWWEEIQAMGTVTP